MKSAATQKLQRITGSMILGVLAAMLLLPSIILFAPRPAYAQGGGLTGCTVSALFAAIGKTEGLAKAAGYAASSISARAAALFTNVPVNDHPSVFPETTSAPSTFAESEGSWWGDLWQNGKEGCLDGLAQDVAKIIIKGMRNLVISYINIGNFGKPTFVTNFQFDAQATARNAARLFASNLTNIDFCNYFPQNPAVNLNFELNLRIGLQCSYQQSREQYQQHLANANLRTPFEDIMLLMPENDPLKVAIAQQQKLSTQVASAAQARQTQVTGGKGFIGREKCVKEKVTSPGGWVNTTTGEPCSQQEIDAGYCQYLYPTTACEEYKTETPGSFFADIATEPLKSELRSGELVDEFEEAIAKIIDTLISKVLSEGLSNMGL